MNIDGVIEAYQSTVYLVKRFDLDLVLEDKQE